MPAVHGIAVLVGTSRSPHGQPVKVSDVQQGMDKLRANGSVRVAVDELGHRCAFVGTVLATLPSTHVAFAAGSRDLDPLASLDLLCWQHRAGDQTADPGHLPEPNRAFLSGDHQSAARWWEERGCPYDSALALVGSGDSKALLSAARVSATSARCQPWQSPPGNYARSASPRYRARQGARPSRPAGLTDREVDVLRLLGAGLRNADIAAHLVVSTRTVDHHVSAVLKKLNTRSRGEAVSAAVRLGIIQA